VSVYAYQLSIINTPGKMWFGLMTDRYNKSVAFARYDLEKGFVIAINISNGVDEGLNNKYYLLNVLYHEKLHVEDMQEWMKYYKGDLSKFNEEYKKKRNGPASHAGVYLKQFEHFSFRLIGNAKLQTGLIAVFCIISIQIW
ncbi:MAG: hypothetical protein IT265_16425, partial [Saprospiraceae bacterium]|nr:hypothetical protein [Saprospiraceae bacterium]